MSEGGKGLSTVDKPSAAHNTQKIIAKDLGWSTSKVAQLARRNLTPFQRAELALKLKPVIAAKAKENIRAVQNNDAAAAYQKSDRQVHTLPELATIAGISHDTLSRQRRKKDSWAD